MIIEKLGLLLFIVSIFAIYDKERADKFLPPYLAIVGGLAFLFGSLIGV